MRLLKYRPLTDKNFKRVCDIVENGEFWCSKLWNMNDPMEGIYRNKFFKHKDSQRNFIEKNKRIICSFSKDDTLSNPLLWGHYANGFRGIAIEIETDEHLFEVEYKELNDFQNDLENVLEIITRKLTDWSYEMEWRFIKEEKKERTVKIGSIKKIYFGTPYYYIRNRQSVENNSHTLRRYNYLKHELELKCKEKGIPTIEFDWYKKRKEDAGIN